jgi:hypothetical protein
MLMRFSLALVPGHEFADQPPPHQKLVRTFKKNPGLSRP